MERTQTTPTPYPTPADREPPVCDACRDKTADRRADEEQFRAEYAQLLRRAHRHLGLRIIPNQADEALCRARDARTAVA
jgi:hypothetical protein